MCFSRFLIFVSPILFSIDTYNFESEVLLMKPILSSCAVAVFSDADADVTNKIKPNFRHILLCVCVCTCVCEREREV